MTMAEIAATVWGSPATWRELAGLGVPVAVPNSDGSWRVPIWTPVRGWELVSWFGADEIRMPAVDDGEDDEQRRERVAVARRGRV